MSTCVATWPALGPDRGGFHFHSGLSVFFPAYNDAPSLPSLLARTFDTLRRYVDDYEVIVVNDGSTDETARVLRELSAEYAPYLRVVTHEQNQGYGGALRSGFAAAAKEWVFYTDGDGQYDPSELLTLLQAVTPDTGLVNGYKLVRNDPWHRIAIGSLYNHFARALFGIKLRDIDCDFRLIRRSLLPQCNLQSTSGTVCVELVRSLELLAPEVLERPVHHFPRKHGRSQFFRLQSLATTLVQLCMLFARLVVGPSMRAKPTVTKAISRRAIAATVAISAVLCFLAYGKSLGLPFIADDYVQIQLGRDYGPVSGWGNLAADALYRCRATSLVMTYWTERFFGLAHVPFSMSSLLVHIANTLLVFNLGVWNVIGWRLSAVAACFFAVSMQHQEAVIWYAALPELLVFLFSLASFLCWVCWLQASKHRGWLYSASLVLYLLALLSKESAVAVVPLMLLALACHGRKSLLRAAWVTPFAAMAGVYFVLGFVNRTTHLHFNDGTFSLSAPFWIVILRSTARLFWVWGLLSMAALFAWREWRWSPVVLIGLAWIPLTLLPYSFLTYMPYVPSRHTYFASVGLSWIVAAGLLALWDRTAQSGRRWVMPAVAALIVVHHCSYLWTRKHHQFELRAAPTEMLVQLAAKTPQTLYIKCFPYDRSVAELAVKYSVAEGAQPELVIGGEAKGRTDAADLCNEATGRGRF